MARLRTLKPGFFTDDELGECSPLARILYAGLWCHADREGRLEDRPKRLKTEVLPYDECDVDALLDELTQHPAGFIIRYAVNGKRYIAIPTFPDHQNPHIKEAASKIPPPEAADARLPYIEVKNETSTGPAPDKNSSSRAGMGRGVGSGLGSSSSANAEGAPAKPSPRPLSPAPKPAGGHLSEAVKAANVLLHMRCDETQRTEVDRLIPNTQAALESWEACLKEWRIRGHKPGLRGPLDWFADGIPPGKPQRNGTAASGAYVAPGTAKQPPPPTLSMTPEAAAASDAARQRVRDQIKNAGIGDLKRAIA